MPITYHSDLQVRAGVTWTINGTLFDAAGKLLDVTNCTLSWCLLDTNGNPMAITATIAKTDPVNGAISITIDKTDTALDPGRLTDALQVVEGANKGVFWIGQIAVQANPFTILGP
jgi:hypothetical protein